MLELWKLLLSAQSNPAGIPTEFLEKKKEEILAKKVQKILEILLIVITILG
jgi:hypothetical protein